MQKRSMKTRTKSTRTFQQTLDDAAYRNWSGEQLDTQPKAEGIPDEEVDKELEMWAEENGYNDNAGLMETSVELGLSPEGEAILLDKNEPSAKNEDFEKKPVWSPQTLRHTKK